MSFDEEYIDPHGECAAEINRLKAERDNYLATLRDIATAGDDFDALRAEFAKPQFMTQSSGPSHTGTMRATVEFTFYGDDRLKRAHDLHDAFIKAAQSVNAGDAGAKAKAQEALKI